MFGPHRPRLKKMKILDRYIIREHTPPFLLALSVFTFILLMDRLFELINLFVNKKVPLGIVLELFGLGLPNIVALTVPMSVLVAVLMTFGRLTQDNEFTALRSSGVSLLRLLALPLAASALVCLGLFWFSDRVLPESNHAFKNLLMDIHQAKPALKLQENAFISDFPGYNILIRRVDEARSQLYGITIYEQGEGVTPRTIIAEKGRLVSLPDLQVMRLELSRGEIHELDASDPGRYHRMSFSRHTINLPLDDRIRHQVREHRSDREMSIAMMRRAIARIDSQSAPLRSQLAAGASLPEWQRQQLESDIGGREREMRSLEVEIQKKLAIPAACVIFVLLGASLGTVTKRGGLGVSAGLSLSFFLLYWACLIGGEELADRRYISPVLAMWAANILLGACGLALTVKQNWELRLRRPRPVAPAGPGGER
jgi:lipopolysaccharide export system permease protein